LGSEPSSADSVAPGSKRWSLPTALARAVVVLRDEGPRALWFKVLGETLYRRLRLVELRPEDAVQAGSLPLEFGFLEPSQAEEYARLRPGVDVAAVRQRLVRERCFAAWSDGRLVSTRWVTAGSVYVDYLGRALPLAPGEVWISDTFTDPPYRGQDVSPAAGAALASALVEEGVHAQLAGVLPENPLGVRAYEQAGYRPVGTVGYIRIGRRRREFVRRHSAKND
jgi:GNAT superfamily N-acetyltransferase